MDYFSRFNVALQKSHTHYQLYIERLVHYKSGRYGDDYGECAYDGGR